MDKFNKGFISALCFVSIYQDLVYKNAQGLIDHINNGGWTDRAITLPLAIFILILINFISRDKS